jgi:murein DD-endopeptidase MepM/ murein hydrolase activator NlpD
MAAENARERKKKRHFTVVLISGTDSSRTRTFSASLWGFIVVIASLLLVLTALITAIIVYTPVGSRLPIANPKLEVEYGRQLQEIRGRMEILFTQLSALRGYNLRLRRAMGEQISPADSGLIAGGEIDTSAPIPETGPAAEEGGTERAAMQTPDGPVAEGLHPAGAAGFFPAGYEEGPDRSLPLSMPTDGFVTREFEPGEFHYGIDFAAKEGTPVRAAAPGHVIYSGWSAADGNMLMISHARGFVTVYKHNRSLLKSTGDAVRRGDLIALVGNTGKSSAPHLHFEVWKDGLAQDAGAYLLTIQ